MKYLEWKIIDQIGHLVLNDPPSNQMTVDFLSSLIYLVDEVAAKAEVQAIVVYGQGRHFSSGAKLDDLREEILNYARKDAQGNIELPPSLSGAVASLLSLENLSIPVVAAIKGVCIGSGLELALACHLRICGANAIFSCPEASFGLMPGCGATQRLPELIGCARARELIFSGDTFSAEEACRYGIVDKVVENKEVINCAIALAKKMVSGNQKGLYPLIKKQGRKK